MSNYTGPYTELSHYEMSKIPAGEHIIISWNDAIELLSAPSGQRPRVYAYVERGASAGQITRLASIAQANDKRETLGFVWVPAREMLITDLVGRA